MSIIIEILKIRIFMQEKITLERLSSILEQVILQLEEYPDEVIIENILTEREK